MAHWQEIGDQIAAAFAARPFAYWREHLRTYTGQWAAAQSLLEFADDAQALANDMLFEVEAIDGGAPIRLVRNPVQFDHEPVSSTRPPQAAEHAETFLMELGLPWERIEALKQSGASAQGYRSRESGNRAFEAPFA